MLLAREKLEYSLPHEIPQQQPQQQPEPRRKSRGAVVKQKIQLTFMVMCCFVMGILVACYYAQVAYVGYKIDLLNGQLADLRLESYNLDQEVNKIISLKQIEAIATGELGMVRPGSNDLVLVTSPLVQADDGNLAALNVSDELTRQRESISLPETLPNQEQPRNRIIQAFTEMVERWSS